jgi:hypothetical protein
MTRGMLRRVQRLEARSETSSAQRVTMICRGERETETEAIERHGLVPGQYRLVILRRYGVAACWCRQSGKTLLS